MSTKYEMSKTYQYRKVMKPLLERKRRARINKCLDDLKDIMAECLQQQSGDPTIKLEKADILEVTLQHLRKVRTNKQSQSPINSINNNNTQHSFRSGYIHAANEVSRCLATFPNIDVQLGTKLMTHLGLRLNQLESASEHNGGPLAISTPLSVNCGSTNLRHVTPPMYSPVSSGYASDSEYSRCSPVPLQSQFAIKSSGLLQVSPQPMWRPW